jgi:hypothetical protein
MLKIINLPRQARDKVSEKPKNEAVFSQEVGWEKYSTLEMLSWAAQYLDYKVHQKRLFMPISD